MDSHEWPRCAYCDKELRYGSGTNDPLLRDMEGNRVKVCRQWHDKKTRDGVIEGCRTRTMKRREEAQRHEQGA